jgi:undecaprenyl pyrophosphate phosphatase UppP
MALPSLAGAVFLHGYAWLKTPTTLAEPLTGSAVSVAVLSSFIVGLLTIRLLIKGLHTGFLQGIALYRVGLGLLLLFGCYVRGWS